MSSGDDEAPDRAKRPDMTTVALDPRTITGNWPVAIATLEQLAPEDGPEALRIGFAVLLYRCAHAMTLPDARADLVVEAQALLDKLRHMPWQGKK